MGSNPERTLSPARRALRTTLFAAALAGAGAYGFFLHRDQVFPYRIARSVYRAVASRGEVRRFHAARLSATDAPVSPESLKQIESLPYLQGYRPATAKGVAVYDRSRALEGLNFFTSGHAPVATLMDMEGAVLKTWTADPNKVFPGLVLSGHDRGCDRFFRSARLLPDGGVVALFEQIGLVRLDAASHPVWAFRARTHHDVFPDRSGGFWVLTREMRTVAEVRPDDPVWEDFVAQLTPEGRLVRRVSILEAFRRSAYAPMLTRLPPGPDVFHTNSLVVLDGSLAGRSPHFREGNILLTIRHLDAVAVLDPQEERIVWALSGQWRLPHGARLLGNGHLLLFDNLGSMRASSRVLELDPLTQEVLWRFGGVSGEDLFSESSSFVQRLSNGDTLIGESNFGRAVEVTPDHRVVWEFVNPNRAGPKGDLVATLYTLDRVPRNRN